MCAQGLRLANDQSVYNDLVCISKRRVFFGHQSVGASILREIRRLAEDLHVESISFVDIGGLPRAGDPFFADAAIGENHYPIEKCRDFSGKVSMICQHGVDAAIMKFCYSDIMRESDAEEIFRNYSATIDSLRKEHPAVRIIPATIPVTVGTGRIPGFGNRLLGRTGNLDMGNVRRSEFNDRVRAYFHDEDIYDVARAMSLDPNGIPKSFSFENRNIPKMFDGYAEADGCHLNSLGAYNAAVELIHVLGKSFAPGQ